jgi:Flp pilus assembly protein TadB
MDKKSMELEELLKHCPSLAEAQRQGIDVRMLLDNLRRPIAERIRRHQAALDMILKLQKAKRL